MSRGARFAERVMLAKGLVWAAPIILSHPFDLTTVIPALLNAKFDALCLGGIVHLCTIGARFLAEVFDQIINGPDQLRQESEHQGNVFER